MATWWQLCVCSLGILLLLPCSLSGFSVPEKFSLAGSSRPVVGVIGQDVVLPCQLSPPARLPSMDVRWRKIGSGFIPVHEYSDEGSQDLPGETYQNRTELFLQEFSSGNVSLKLKRLQVVDDGKYQCFVRNPEWSREATTELRVAAVAPVFIDMLGPRGQGIGLACRSAGWFPKPELQWVGKNWQNLSMEIVTNVTQDRENLYSVVSHITVTEGEENGDISCLMQNGLLAPERQLAIHLSRDVFPRVSPWLAAFWVIFTLFLIAAGACAYLGYAAKLKASQKKCSEEEALSLLEAEKKTLEAGCQELRQLLDANTKAFETAWQKLSKKFDARRNSFESGRQELYKLLDAMMKAFQSESQENETKLLKSEFSKLREMIDAMMKAFQSEHQELCEMIDANMKTFEKDKGPGLRGSVKMGTKSLKKLKEEVRKIKDISEEEKASLMEKMSKLKQEKDELLAQIGSDKIGRKSLKKLKEEVRKIKDISEEEKASLMEKIRKLEQEKDELLAEIASKKWKPGRLQKENDELTVELKWRRARTYADDITLDARTAHPNLSIPGDEKSLKHEAQPQKVPPSPERFDSTVCVFGSEGFSSGKHYWEVDVTNSTDWDLGVARKSAQRKGKLSLSPKEGFWALGLSQRDYWAKTDPWTRVMVQKKPKKIGIYLGYQDRQVTFFNVTDMSVLFTFNDCSFSGEVYPFFKNSYKETSMRICSIREDECI